MYAHICVTDFTLNLFVLWPHLCKLINNQTHEVPNSSPPYTPCLKANQFMKMSSVLSSISVQISPLRMLLCIQHQQVQSQGHPGLSQPNQWIWYPQVWKIKFILQASEDIRVCLQHSFFCLFFPAVLHSISTRHWVAHYLDVYLDELHPELEERLGVSVATSTIWRSLVKGGYSMKKACNWTYCTSVSEKPHL